jgi:hypothetical protein
LDRVIDGRPDYKKEIRNLKKYLEVDIRNLIFLDGVFDDVIISRIQEARNKNNERIYRKRLTWLCIGIIRNNDDVRDYQQYTARQINGGYFLM